MDSIAQCRRILVVEDEFMIADEMVRMLHSQGFDVVGPTPTVAGALALLAQGGPIDGAILDVNLRNERAYPVADALRDRDIPFIFSTGYAQAMLPEEYQDVPHFDKPAIPPSWRRCCSRPADDAEHDSSASVFPPSLSQSRQVRYSRFHKHPLGFSRRTALLFIKVDEIEMVFNAHHLVRISPRGDYETTVLLSVGKPDSMTFRVPYAKFVAALESAGSEVVLKVIEKIPPPSTPVNEASASEA